MNASVRRVELTMSSTQHTAHSTARVLNCHCTNHAWRIARHPTRAVRSGPSSVCAAERNHGMPPVNSLACLQRTKCLCAVAASSHLSAALARMCQPAQ